MAKEIERWVTIGGKHVPIYKGDPVSKKDAEIAQQKEKTNKLTTQKKAEDLLVQTKQFKYTHNDMKQMFSRAQVFPIYNKSAAYITKLDNIIKKLDDGPLKEKLEKERHRLYLQHRDLLEPHRQRVCDEVDGKQVFMNDKYYHSLGY